VYGRGEGGERKLDALPSVFLGAVGGLALRNVVHQPTITPAMYECSLSPKYVQKSLGRASLARRLSHTLPSMDGAAAS
jgi:hypothetical protein